MIGKTVSHYEITGKLGEGGMGVVYKARDTKLNRDVALKFLPAGLTSDEESRKRFVREAQAAAALNHPNICAVYEIGESDGHTFIVMPCIEGAGLAGRLKDGPLPVDDALDIAIQVGKGLSKAHKNDIIHRDIKPGNILITEDGHAKIVDFGLAKLGSMSKMTMVGTTLGTVGYMSPEQARGDEVDHHADIWALGVVLYEMLSGQMPFRGEVDAAVIYSIMNEEPEPLVDVCPECPEQLGAVIGTALAKETTYRFQSMDEMVAALEAIRGGKSVPTVKRSSGKPRGRIDRRATIGAIAVIIIAVAILGYIFLWPTQTIGSIAVLPIIDLSGDNETGSAADQITAVLTGELGQIKSVRVISYRTTMKYKDSDMSISEIARELDIDAVIEGELIADDSRMKLSLRLVKADPEEQLWSRQYDRSTKENFTLFGEVAMDFAKELNAVISPEAAAAMASRRDVDQKAWDAYAMGIYLNSTYVNAGESEEGRKKAEQAVEYLKTAVEIDSMFAQGWAGLAETYIRQSHGHPPPPDAVEKALHAVNRAIELDDALGEAYFTKAHILWEHVWDQEGAREAFRKAFELNPSNAYGKMIYAYYLTVIGRPDEAADAVMEAVRLDPVTYLINLAAWQPLALACRTDEAIAQVRKVREMYPEKMDEIGEKIMTASIYYNCEDYERAMKVEDEILDLVMVELQDSSDAMKEDARTVYFYNMAIFNTETGNEEEAQRLWDKYRMNVNIDTLEKYDHYVAVTYHSYQGDLDRAFMLLEKQYEKNDMWLTRIASLPHYKRLHGDPRYDDLLKRMGLR